MTQPSKEQGMAESETVPATGGSAAGQAYREELARQGQSASVDALDAPAAGGTSPPAPKPTGEARAAVRKKVNGRARVVLAGSGGLVGKMIDISLTGACVLLDDMLPSKRNCVLEFDIFHEGQRYVFSAQAISIYGVLVSGKGFKVGFQFGPNSPVATKSIAALAG